jgi:hypothetical protein
MDLLNVGRLVEDFKAGQVTHLEELRMQLEMSIRGSETREANEPGNRFINSQNSSN